MSLLETIEHGASADYRAFLAGSDASRSIGDYVLLYGKRNIEERNATYEIQTYLPGWIAIGDDGGGTAVLMRLDGSNTVFRCGHGALGSIDPEQIADSFASWLASECPWGDRDELDEEE